MSKITKLEHVAKGAAASLYTIVFNNDDLSEFAKYIVKFKDNARLKRDYQIILLALDKIMKKVH